MFVVDGARSPLFGRFDVGVFECDGVEGLSELFRVLGTGNAGKAVVGGPKDGLDGLGSAAAIVSNYRSNRFTERSSLILG